MEQIRSATMMFSTSSAATSTSWGVRTAIALDRTKTRGIEISDSCPQIAAWMNIVARA